MAEAVFEVYVQPGESHLVTRPAVMRTLLGSCVGVAFWVPERGIGALCHPMMPHLPMARDLDLHGKRRYVDFAIREMSDKIEALGIARRDVKVKLFGGADVLAIAREGISKPTVGRMNCEMATRILEEEGIEVIAQNLGGTRGFNIQFHTGTGEVLLRRLS